MPPTVLIQLDCDAQPSSFDSIVAIDAGVDQLLRYSDVRIDSVVPLVHGAMFTRGGAELSKTAIFVGGSDVTRAEAVCQAVRETFFGPVRVSVMLDANGCNTTAAAAVVSAARHASLAGSNALVLGGTGPVGQRVARLLAGEGAKVRLASRTLERAREACQRIASQDSSGSVDPVATDGNDATRKAIEGCEIIIACGAAGVELVSKELLAEAQSLRVAIDLNAVPPSGLEGIAVTAKAEPIVSSVHSAVGYGAIGVGGLKMKTHRQAIRSLFEANDRVLDAEAIYAIAKQIG